MDKDYLEVLPEIQDALHDGKKSDADLAFRPMNAPRAVRITA